MEKKKLMRSILLSLSYIVILAGLSGCGKKDDVQQPDVQEFLTEAEFSYLIDANSQEVVRKAMTDAGISDFRQQVFFEHVDQFNYIIKDKLAEGFQRAEISAMPLYDPYELQDAWNLAYPDLFGYNCRITSYSLMADFIRIDNGVEMEKRDEFLAFDLNSLDLDSSALMNEQDLERFRVLFSVIPTVNTKDTNVHVENIQKDWKERGISFEENTGVTMISVFFHDKLDENTSELFIGHVGVLLEQADGGLLFIEKVAFQEPYQAVCFHNRIELNDYLMSKYDISYGQETASPIIFENDKLLEGYRLNVNNSENVISESREETSQDVQMENGGEVRTFIGRLEAKKDMMFIITNDSGEAYSVGFEKAPEGYEQLKEGDMVIMEYTGKLSVVDSFSGEILSIKKME